MQRAKRQKVAGRAYYRSGTLFTATARHCSVRDVRKAARAAATFNQKENSDTEHLAPDARGELRFTKQGLMCQLLQVTNASVLVRLHSCMQCSVRCKRDGLACVLSCRWGLRALHGLQITLGDAYQS